MTTVVRTMTDEEVAQVVGQRGGLMLRDGDSLFVLDRHATRSARVPRDGVAGEDSGGSASRLDEVLGDPPPARPLIVAAHLLVDEDGAVADPEAVMRVLESFASANLQLTLHRSSPGRWGPLMDWVGGLRRWQPEPRRLQISVAGAFEGVDPADCDLLFRNRVHLQSVHGWWPGCSPEDYTRVREDELRELAEFGFEVPAVWYVHGGNVAAMPELIDASLSANCYAGFSAIMLAQSPLHDGDGGPGHAASSDYLDSLARLYEDYPHYDRLFAPLNELAEQCVIGGWDERDDRPTRIKLLFRGDGQARTFRQVPFLSQPWESTARLAGLNDDEVRSSLINWHRRTYSLSVHPLCHSCRWRSLCGGVDSTWQERGEPAPDDLMAAICEHRRLFLEVFVLQRCRVSSES